METKMLQLIQTFEDETAQMLSIFLERTGLNSPFEARDAGLPRRGYLPGKPRIVYRFHGIGLELRIGRRHIDFDFGFDGRAGGFNSWWLLVFAKERPILFPEFQNVENIQAALTKAREAGEIGKPFQNRQDSLEYRLK